MFFYRYNRGLIFDIYFSSNIPLFSGTYKSYNENKLRVTPHYRPNNSLWYRSQVFNFVKKRLWAIILPSQIIRRFLVRKIQNKASIILVKKCWWLSIMVMSSLFVLLIFLANTQGLFEVWNSAFFGFWV